MFKMDVGKRIIFQLSAKTLETTKVILAFTPHKLPWCFAIYQEWVQAFNPNHLVGFKLPT